MAKLILDEPKHKLVLDEPDVSTFDTFDDETKAKIENSILYSSISNSDPNDVFGYTDEINEQIYGTPSNVAAKNKSKKTYEDTKSWMKTIKDGYDNAGVGMVKGVAGVTLAMAELNKKLWNAIGRERPQIIEDIATNSEEWSNMMRTGISQYYKENPDKMIELDPELGLIDTLKEYATRPKVLIQSLIESAPIMLEAGLGTITAGPAGGITVMATARSGEVYSDARAEGTEVLPAFGQAVLTGTIEAGIEQWTFGKKLGLAKNMSKLVSQGLPKILWEGNKAFFRGTAEEGTQKFNENFWRWVFTDRTQSLTEGVGQAMGAGGITELAMAGAFGAAGMTTGNTKPIEQQKQILNKLETQVNDNKSLTPEQKTEIKVEIDKARVDVEAGKYAPTETTDTGEKPVPPISELKVDFANRQNLPEAPTIDEQAKPSETPTEDISQEQGQVAQEIEPESKAVEMKGKEAWEMTKDEYEIQENMFFHGTPSGEFGAKEIHVGTKRAAQEALEARIGIPADGNGWRGKTNYGDTLLAGKKSIKSGKYGEYRETGFNVENLPEEDFYLKDYPELAKKAQFGNGEIVPLNSKPNIIALKIKGKMSNVITSPLSDTKANATIKAMLKKGVAKSGYFYENIGEDEGSISAVVPSKQHLETHKNIIRQALSEGKSIPRNVLEEYKGESWADEALAKTEPVVKENLTGEENVNILQNRDVLGGEDPVFVLGQNLKTAKELVPVIQAEQKAAQKERFQKMKDVAQELIEKQGLTPSQALNIARMQLSGEQTEYNRRFESIRDRMEQSSPGTIKALELTVWQSPQLQLMDKNDLIVALNKLIDGNYLQKAEIRKIREFFGDALGDIAETRRLNIPWYEQLVDMWRVGLLTGVKTSTLNLQANLSHAITETVSDNIAAGVDAFISKVLGTDRTIAATVKGEIRGLMKKGIPEFKHYMKTGVDNRIINAKWDYTERSYGNGKWAKFRLGYINTVFHLMGAEDMLFYYAAEGRSYYNQALAQGMNEGLSGKELTDYADKLAVKPTEKMIEIGINDAEIAVFMNKTVAGDFAAAIQDKIPVLGKVIVPFSRTPAAIGMQIINYTPAGVAKEVIQQIHQGKFDQRKFSQAFGRSIVGTAALVIGAELLKAGLMTLAYPKGERERKLWEVEGRKPFSIKVGNKWRSVYVLGPAGNVLLIGGYFQQAYQETGSPTEAMTVSLFGGAKSIAEQTFLRGLNQALSAVSDPEMSWNRWFSDMAGSAVPTIIADFARAIDTTERRAEGPLQKIQNRLPLTRELLQPKLDIFGQDLPRYGGNPLEVMVDPTRPVKINQDIVVDELRRLWDVDVKVSPTLLGDRMGYDVLSDEENTLLWRNAGRYTYSGLFSMMMSSEYKTETDEGKGKMIDELVKNAKDLARAEIVMSKMSEGYTETELRKDGLLTNDVKKLLGD